MPIIKSVSVRSTVARSIAYILNPDKTDEVKRGKYISIRAKGQQRFVRLKTLGDEYAEDSIIEHIF